MKEKQKQAELALQMCDILDEKPEGYRKQLEELRTEISGLNHATGPKIDITNLKGIRKNERRSIEKGNNS